MKYEVVRIDSQGNIVKVALVADRDVAMMLASLLQWRDMIRYHGRSYEVRSAL